MADLYPVYREAEYRVSPSLFSLRVVMVGSDALKLNSFDVIGTAPGDDFRFARHRGDIIVVEVVMAHCNNVDSVVDRCVAEPAALRIRVGNNPGPTIRTDEERSMSKPFHLHRSEEHTSELQSRLL